MSNLHLCTWCDSPLARCEAVAPPAIKCCPDCRHPLEDALARVRDLHKPESRYTTDGTWSDDKPELAAAYAGVDVSELTQFKVCAHCGAIEMRQAGDVGDYLEALWPCATSRALEGEVVS